MYKNQFTGNKLTRRRFHDWLLRMSNVPGDLKYSKSHEWVRLEGEIATVGITDHAQRELTSLVFVELPKVGRVLRAGESCAVVESVKAASDVYSPISGEVTEVNTQLANQPELVNTDPYGAGWFFRMRVKDPSEISGLLDPSAYRALAG